MQPEPPVVRALARLMADEPLEATSNGFPKPWRGIMRRLAEFQVVHRPAALEAELKELSGIDTDRLIEAVFGANGNHGPVCRVLAAALAYRRRGWSVVPVKPGTKRPACKWEEYQHQSVSEEQVRHWFDPEHGGAFQDLAVVLGEVSGRLAVRDFDVGAAYDHWADQYHEYARMLPTVKTARGCHVYIRLPEDSQFTGTVNLGDGELRADGGIVLLPPSRHPSGTAYEWIIPLPENDVPEIDPSEIGLADPPKTASAGVPDGAISEGSRNTALTSLAGSMRRRGMTESAIVAALLEENATRCSPPLDEEEVRRIAASVGRYQPEAQLASVSEHNTDVGNAKRLIVRHGQDLHYVPHWKKWLIWDGQRWRRDDLGDVTNRAKETVAELYAAAGASDDAEQRRKLGAWALQSESEHRLQAMVNLARSEPGIAIEPGVLDVDPWLLNCENGTVDLRTGQLRPHTRSHLLTKIVPVAYDPEAACPRWESFLDRILEGNRSLIGFIQRAVGYSLTGSTREHCLFILYGTGRNGKTTFLETLAALLAEYAQQTPMETLMVRRGQSIPNDVARLKGARLVTAAESEEGQRLRESLIKQMTGGDRVAARFLHGEFFEFVPTCKLFLAVNHRPVIRGTDTAIWERIRLVPFNVTIPKDERDPELLAKLRAELPGILRWAVEGCQEWLQDGLGPSREVLGATEEYRHDMDVLGDFIDERCVCHATARVRSTELYTDYKNWCTDTNEKPLRQRDFVARLQERGFEKIKSGVYQWTGIGLLTEES